MRILEWLEDAFLLYVLVLLELALAVLVRLFPRWFYIPGGMEKMP